MRSLILLMLGFILTLCGCSERKSARPAVQHPASSHPLRTAKPLGSPVPFKGFTFVQDGLHNCGTIAMLISWANTHPQQAANLVRKQPDGSYLVSFKQMGPVRVTTADLAAADKARMLRVKRGDNWARIVLTAFVKLKCESEPLNFRVTDWIYPGEIGYVLTGGEMGDFQIKQESTDAKGRVQVGSPVSSSVLKRALDDMKGKPAVAYTNRRIHIWAVMDYNADKSKILLRNPRHGASEWFSVDEFARGFEVVTYVKQ